MKTIVFLLFYSGLACLGVLRAEPEKPKAPAKEKEDGQPTKEDPADAYFQGWLLSRDAEKLRGKGKNEEAKAKLLQALKYFRVVHQQWPEWKKEMVRGRLLETERVLQSLGWKEGATI